MNFLRGFRIQRALFVFVLVLVLGLGLVYLHQAIQVIRPLSRELAALPGVENVMVTKGVVRNGSRIKVNIKLRDDIPLATSFDQVRSVLSETNGLFSLELEDVADGELEMIYSRVRVAVEEAIMTGEFTLLENRVSELGNEYNVSWKLDVDRQFIYIILRNSTNTLQRVISRSDNYEGMQIQIKEKVGTQWLKD